LPTRQMSTALVGISPVRCPASASFPLEKPRKRSLSQGHGLSCAWPKPNSLLLAW